jgi:hypothetical protein
MLRLLYLRVISERLLIISLLSAATAPDDQNEEDKEDKTTDCATDCTTNHVSWAVVRATVVVLVKFCTILRCEVSL